MEAYERFMSVPLISDKPERVSLIAWALRKTLPWVRDHVDSDNIVMVLYASDSPYERFLLGGRGAGHYDAAREWLDGSLDISWTGGASAVASNLTHVSLQQEGSNMTDSPSGQHVSSRAKRSRREINDGL
ncbi:MAG: hypothetical protein Q9228_004033 [Teloschistes exilis]